MYNGIFGGLFDFDGDGKMDAFETAAELFFLNEIVLPEESRQNSDSWDSDPADFDFDD